MSNLAIRGHATRGKEVIEILEMLGGVNRYHRKGNVISLYYYIGSTTHIYSTNEILPTEYFVFTLEEFLEKFPYKVGDKVKVKETGKDVTIEGMSWRNGCEVIYDTCYNNDCVAFYSAEELQPYKEETMEEIKIDIPKGYKFAGVDDDKQQVVFTKIQSQYPKTYEECCMIIGFSSNTFKWDNPFCINRDTHPYIKNLDNLIESFYKLLICRDAYWKIAGDEMGLGKPWEPDWVNEIYTCTIICRSNKVVKDGGFDADNRILAFPTEKMRDAFYENFKDLIEQCKELL